MGGQVHQRRLSDDIVERLETMIPGASQAAGERPPAERVLAERFWRLHARLLREAIQKLRAKGLLVSRQGGGNVAAGAGLDLQRPAAASAGKQPDAQRDLLEFRHTLRAPAFFMRRSAPRRSITSACAPPSMNCSAAMRRTARPAGGGGRRRCAFPPGDCRGQPQRRAAAHHPRAVRPAQAQRGDQYRRHVTCSAARPATACASSTRHVRGDHRAARGAARDWSHQHIHYVQEVLAEAQQEVALERAQRRQGTAEGQ